MVLEDGVRIQISTVESVEKVAEPGVRGIGKRLQHRVQEELAEVVDLLADESGDSEVVGETLPLALG